ncbi:MAG: FtsX-like permease family protein, partial [Spirochaetaceae bacterium]|nr:FtsX-like permease family protein [Spirochaetaceae bacterium]
MVKAPTDLPVSVFGAITPSIEDFFTIPEIPAQDIVKANLLSSNYVDSAVSLISGRAIFRYKGYSKPIPIFGIDGDEYFNFFPGLKVIQGKPIRTGEIGLLITKSRADKITSQLGTPPEIGEPVLLSSYANGNFKIRELPLAGIIEYENPISVLDEVVLIDAQTLRELNQVTLAVDTNYIPEESSISLMDNDSGSLDNLFSTPPPNEAEDSGDDEGITLDLLNSVMKEQSQDKEKTLTGGGWHFILLRFKEGFRPKTALSALNNLLESQELQAVGWRDAAGLSAFLILLLRVLFNGGFVLVVTAGVIAVVNILVISIIERTGEIGTLRAIGSTRSFVRCLLVTENVLLALVSGILALIAGAITLSIVNHAQIHLNNDLLSSL